MKTQTTDAVGKFSDIRIQIADVDCESCGNTWFQLGPDDPDRWEPVEVTVVCCGCGETLWLPAPEDNDADE